MRLLRTGAGASVCWALALAPLAQGAEPSAVVRGLDNPCGVAVQPGTGHVFVSTRPGVFRLVPGKAGLERHAEVVGFPTDSSGRGPEYEIGPLGLAFLDGATLVVGGGELQDGEELVRFFAVGRTPRPAGKALKPDDMKASS